MTPSKIKLLNRDVMVTYVDQSSIKHNGVIQVIEQDEKTQSMQYFKVVNVSNAVTMTKTGDTIILELGKHTIPFDLNNVMYAITSEDDIVAVID